MRWAFFLAAASSLGCFAPSWCPESGCAPPPSDACEGQCVPFLGAGWEPVLVSTAAASCPAAAPFAAMHTSSITVCGVQPAEGSCSAGLECLPAAPAWTACVVRDGAHACVEPYPVVTAVPEASLCCPKDEPAR